jgi:translocator protein
MKGKIKILFYSFGLVILAMVVGALAPSAINYPILKLPSFAPPAWVFGPAWTLLYILMAFSCYLIWREAVVKNIKAALAIFYVQLFLNAIWTPLFFALNWRFVASIEIIILWLLIIVNILLFWKIKKSAGALLIPYFLWVSFASILSFAVWRLNI